MNVKTNRYVLILLLFVLLLPFVYQQGWVLTYQNADDFPSFYYAQKLAFEYGLSPYTPQNWQYAAQAFYSEETLYAFLYMPPSLLIFRLFGLFDYPAAKLAMLALNYLCILLFAILFLFRYLKLKPDQNFLLLALVYLLCFTPLYQTLGHGQVNLWVLLAITVAWYGYQTGKHPALSGGALAFAILIKQSPLFLLLYFLIKKQYRIVLWALAFLATLGLIALFVLPAGLWQDWLTHVVSNGYGNAVRGIHPAMLENQSLNGFFARLFIGRPEINPPLQPLFPHNSASQTITSACAGLLALLTLGITLWKNLRRPVPPANNDTELALFVTALFLLNPISWNHHLTFILPALLVTLYQLTHNEEHPALILMVGLACALLAFDYPFSHYRFRQGVLTLLISAKMFAVLLVWGYHALRCFIPHRQVTRV